MARKKSHIPSFRKATASLRAAYATADARVRAFVNEEADDFKDRIERQDFTSFVQIPLAPATIERKKLLKLDLRTMIATKTYIRGIKVFRTARPGVVRYKIGFAPNARARDADGNVIDLTLNELAMIHEHGAVNGNIPARPHWAPHLQDMRERATILAEEIASEIQGG